DERLQKDCGFGGVEAGGEEINCDLQGVFGDGGGVGVVGGEGVPIGDEEEAVVGGSRLQAKPGLERTEVGGKGGTGGGEDAGEDAISGGGQVGWTSVDWNDGAKQEGYQISVIR